VGPQTFSVCNSPDAIRQEDIQKAQYIMHKAVPAGVTPLARHLQEIREELEELSPHLNATGEKVVIVLATDGLPTDSYGMMGQESTNKFIDALKALEPFRIWIVVRLCTNDDNITEFYNDIDKHLEKPIEVLDDFKGESSEVYKVNKWLNYALPLHRCREVGFHHRMFDLIDERRLTMDEMLEFVTLLFGDKIRDLPDPAVDWSHFSTALQQLVIHEPHSYNPVRNSVLPWIDIKELDSEYGHGGLAMRSRGAQQECACTLL